MLSKCSTLSFSGWLNNGMKSENSSFYNTPSSFSNSTNGMDASSAVCTFSDLAACKATKIMCHLATVGSIIEYMVQYPGVLCILKCIVDTINPTCEEGGTGLSNKEDKTRINSPWVLGNLSCTPDNMRLIFNYAGIIDTLLCVMNQVRLVHNMQMDLPSKIRRIAAARQSVRVLLNLSWADENKTSLLSVPTLLKR